ncbi:heme-thiolate peroxidase [Boeremia exigua]|uniref:Heme-thiolate peroxidase n=1 Tax=Boeremia exigua TaxID=749465 RepID=A0ACC2IRI6_9PLEO|nr:heme-thiolate peroxidase [Boeremia exigua]
MRFQNIFIVVLYAVVVSSFPTRFASSLANLTTGQLRKSNDMIQSYLPRTNLIVDSSKPIDISGRHVFQAPSNKDQRGPCPGLNALANHNYIARDGITSLLEVVTAINQVFGMGVELASVLGVMGTVWTGNPLSVNPGFSIGGTVAGDGSDNILGNLVGLQGDPRGLQGSHNWIESDSSLTRDDLYVTSDAWSMNMTLFHDIYNRADEHGIISMDLLAEQAARRWKHSVIGGNTGTVNSFSGLDLHNITGGLLSSASLLEDNNLLCFVFQVLKTFTPNSLSPLLASLAFPISLVTDVLAAPLLSLACPAWEDLTEGGEPLWNLIQRSFPGASQAGSSL